MFSNSDCICLGVSWDIWNNPESLFASRFGAVSEHSLQLIQHILILDIVRAYFFVHCEKIPKETDTVLYIFHAEFFEHVVHKHLQVDLTGDQLDLLIAPIFNEISYYLQKIALKWVWLIGTPACIFGIALQYLLKVKAY